MVAAAVIQPPTSAATSLDRLRAAQKLIQSDRRRGLDALNALFREGTVPSLDGRCPGELVAMDLAPGLSPLLEAVARWRLPWNGKTFDAKTATGDNIFQRSAWTLAHVLWPFYRAYIADTADTFRAFTFRTYTGAGKADPDVQVLKIDYALPGNPPLSIHRILDELVEVGPGVYLGKAHLQWWWGRWQMVAFFLLRDP